MVVAHDDPQLPDMICYLKAMYVKAQPVSLRIQSVLTNVHSFDSGHTQQLTSDGHSSTASYWTIQRLYVVHCNCTPRHCKFNRQQFK